MTRAFRARPGCVAALAAALILMPSREPAEAQGFELVTPATERSVSLVVGTGQLIKVDGEFTSLFVANPDVADIEVKSPRLLYLTGVGVGETTLFAVDDDDNVLMSANIKVTHNGNALDAGFARVAPGQNVTATTVDQSLVVTGTVQTPEQADNIMRVASQFVDEPSQLINRLTVAAPTQVNLQVRIAEVNRNIDRQLGIRWGAIGVNSSGSKAFDFQGGSGVPGGWGAGIGYFSNSLNIDVMLQALSEEGMITILAEPNLTARSGETANFLAGGEYPYSTVSENGTNVEFKDFGIGLNFTPTVVDGSRISLLVATEVSELSFADNANVPSLVTRRAQTTVDLGSGQSFAIAGLMQNSSAQNASRMPGLGSVPVLGTLFRSTGFRRGQTELVIIVTPVIVGPVSSGRAKLPTDSYVPPNDFERIIMGRFQGNPQQVNRVQNRMGQRRLYGASGFVFQ